MCGIVAIAGARDAQENVRRALGRLHHRGPDASGEWSDDALGVAMGHRRLSIIDLSEAGRCPMESTDGRYVLTFNGEVYNYLELRVELEDVRFRSHSDTEVVLAAWERWGPACLDRLIGMFAFAIWDRRERRLFAVRDRFGVKPLYVTRVGDGIALASEIKALHAIGAPRVVDTATWATYLAKGLTDHSNRTFWKDIESVPGGCLLEWDAENGHRVRRWYDIAERVGNEPDTRDPREVKEEYRALVTDSVRLRFRADVPVGINLYGGVDSSTLLGLVHAIKGTDSNIEVFTFATGDENYDETPWVEAMLARTRHPLNTCVLTPDAVIEQFSRIAAAQDEPFGGIPTLAYANIFACARAKGVLVLLDGQGMDEQWAGYDYYRATETAPVPTVQGSTSSAVRPDVLAREFVSHVEPFTPPAPFSARLRNLQLRDTLHTKIPRALRYNDRISMAASTELREPFLDHRVVELAMRQPDSSKIRGDIGKWLLRELAADLVPEPLRLAPKRALQTPQREWLRGPLRTWATDRIETALRVRPEWFDAAAVRSAWAEFVAGNGDNSFWVWQWLSIASD